MTTNDKQTITPVAEFITATATLDEIAVLVVSMVANRRESILRELSGLERDLGYGGDKKPTTSQLRAMWRRLGGRCPHCGGELK